MGPQRAESQVLTEDRNFSNPMSIRLRALRQPSVGGGGVARIPSTPLYWPSKTMKYLLLIYANEAIEPQPGTPEFGALIEGYGAFSREVEEKGVLLGGEALKPVQTASTLRVREGKVQISDGPFAETKEQLGGFYMLDCKDLDEALDFASRIPSAEHGCVEVRPVMVFE